VIVAVDAVLTAQFTRGSGIGVLYGPDDVSGLVLDTQVTGPRRPAVA
jgi:hypothetical protein